MFGFLWGNGDCWACYWRGRVTTTARWSLQLQVSSLVGRAAVGIVLVGIDFVGGSIVIVIVSIIIIVGIERTVV